MGTEIIVMKPDIRVINILAETLFRHAGMSFRYQALVILEILEEQGLIKSEDCVCDRGRIPPIQLD